MLQQQKESKRKRVLTSILFTAVLFIGILLSVTGCQKTNQSEKPANVVDNKGSAEQEISVTSNSLDPDTLFEFLLMNWDDVRTNEKYFSSLEPVVSDDNSEVMIGYYQDGDITFDTYFLLEIGEAAYDSFSTEKGTILGVRYEYSTTTEEIDDAISVMEQILDETEHEFGEADTLPYAINQYHSLENAKGELLSHDKMMWSEEWYLSNIDPNMVLHIRIFRMDNKKYVIKEYEINPMAAKQFMGNHTQEYS